MNKTVHTAETEQAATESAGPATRAHDAVGAAVHTLSRSSDAVVASRTVASVVGSLWEDYVAPWEPRITEVSLAPLVATDASAALQEAGALAADGLRTAVIDEGPEMGPSPPHPLVRFRIVPPETADPADPLTLVARSSQQAMDFAVIAQMAAETSLCPLTVLLPAHVGVSLFERTETLDVGTLENLLGRPSDEIDSPNAYQRKVFGERRRRVPTEMPDGVDSDRLREDAKKLLDAAIKTYESVTGRKTTSDDRRNREARSADFDWRMEIRSGRAFSLARLAAESISSGAGLSTSVTGMPADTCVHVLVGSADSDAVDALVWPGRTRRGLDRAAVRVREGGMVLLETDSADAESLWRRLPDSVRSAVRERNLRLFAVDTAGSEDGQNPVHFESVLPDFAVGAIARDLRDGDGETARAGGGGRSNGEANETSERADVAFVDVPWRDYEEEPDFYAESPRLHLTGAPPDEPSDEIRRQLVSFHYSGYDTGERIDDAGLVPVPLFEYLSSDAVTGPYPVLIPDSADAEPSSLVTVMNRLRDEQDSDDGRDLVGRIESTLIEEHAADPDARLIDVWSRAEQRVLDLAGHEVETTRKALRSMRDRLGDGRICDFGPDTTLRLLELYADREWSSRFEPVREDAEALAIMMEEFLRADYGGSEEGRAPDHLRAAVGKGYADELDFDAFAELVDEARAGEPLPAAHRARLESTANDLRTLPVRLAQERDRGTFLAADGLARAVARSHENLRTVAALIRAVRIGLLESSGRYREEVHDPMFSQFGVEHLTDEERALCPPYVVRLGSSAELSRAARGALMEVLGSDLPITIVVDVEELPSRIRAARESDPASAATAALALQAIGLGTAYVMQGPASAVAACLEAASGAAAYHGPALFSIYYGSVAGRLDSSGYIASAVALESRAFPLFTFNPSGAGWAERISVDGNPATEAAWPYSEVSYETPGSGRHTLSTAFTFADYLALDASLADHFRIIPVGEWQPEMIPVDEFVDLDDTQKGDRIPYLWMADERGRLERVVMTYPITDAVAGALRSWRTVQELGGVKSSFAERIIEAERAKLEEERQRIADAAREQIQSELDRATGSIARDIVSNIASGLLGLRPTTEPGRPLPHTEAPSPADAPVPAPEEAPEEEIETAEPPQEEEEVIALDEPYIETPRCTTCNECTNLNPRMFAYDENRQAYIKDASAGTFRELVLAAEKCPVRIIHPGKPLNPDEPGLDELIKRAQPFQ